MGMILRLRVSPELRQRWPKAANEEGLRLSSLVRKHCETGLRQQKNGSAGSTESLPPSE